MNLSKRAHFFVDEAGDLSLFDKKGRTMLGREGVSQVFMLGVAYIPAPNQAQEKLDALRASLLADLYFSGVPSFQPAANKTAIFFHAKDDLPEVRREVLKILPTLGAQMHVAIRRKDVLLAEARTLYQYGRKLKAADIYDDLTMRLFRNLLHTSDENEIVFARRGKTLREEALAQAIRNAKQNFAARWGKFHDKPTTIRMANPSEIASLQVADYYLWVLQRLFEKGEERYFSLLASDFKVIMDLDDKRTKSYGAWYTPQNPILLEKIKPLDRLGSSGPAT